MILIEAINGLLTSPAANAALWGCSSSFALCILLVLTGRWHGVWTMDCVVGIQKFHTTLTPRVGGIPIVLGLVVAWGRAPVEIKNMITPILLAGMPAFLFGLAEDITKRVGVMPRLLATMVSGLLAWWITDYSLSRVDLLGAEFFLKFTLVSVIFTSFAIGGVANAINIIDGFNGLAGIMSSLAFAGYAMIAWQAGDHNLAGVSLIMAACVWGFFWVNWPFGKIFLGDGGSYFVGFALAFVAVMLIERNPSVSVFAVLLVCAYPVIEVFFTIYRRKIKKLNPGHPDRLHFHSLLKQRYIRRWLMGSAGNFRNSFTGLLVGSITLAPVVMANLFYTNAWLSAAACAGLVLGYAGVYGRMVITGAHRLSS